MQSTSNSTVLILAAGYGRRMGPFSRMVNKGLIPYGEKPLISHIMDKFDISTKFVIACGNMGEQVKDYVSTVHADKNVTFVDIPEFAEGTTGPATTIRYCKEHLKGGFMWITCDTLFDFDFSKFTNENWIGVHPVDSAVASDYCWVERNGNDIISIHNKEGSAHAVDAFIGLMNAKDDTFIENLDAIAATEVYQGFGANLELKAHNVASWKDFGTYEKWKQLTDTLPEISFPKPDELFYADNGKIVKFTTNQDLAHAKYSRYTLNEECFPANVSVKGGFLFYDYADGETLYNCLTPETFKSFLDWCVDDLWVLPEFPADENVSGIRNEYLLAREFYYTKTNDRLSKFRTKYNDWAELPVVNSTNVLPIDEYLRKINFEWLFCTTEQVFIHGDMQFDNIIYDANTEKFTAIDWRPDFAGDSYGDIYYDLAKMLGGLYLSYKDVKGGRLRYTETLDEVVINLPSVDNVDLYVGMLQNWVEDRGLDWNKVRTLVPIIYLNMAPLHDAPFDKYLIALAQLFFSKL